jgi:hypothetical protein
LAYSFAVVESDESALLPIVSALKSHLQQPDNSSEIATNCRSVSSFHAGAIFDLRGRNIISRMGE